jgi:hypothetical protein
MTRFTIFQAKRPTFDASGGFDASLSYRVVWTDDLNGRGLEDIFRDFQRVDEISGPWPPEGYTGRSLSESDIVVIRVDDEEHGYLCAAFGWDKLDEADVRELLHSVKV